MNANEIEATAIKAELGKLHDRIRVLRYACTGEPSCVLNDAMRELNNAIRSVDVARIDFSYGKG